MNARSLAAGAISVVLASCASSRECTAPAGAPPELNFVTVAEGLKHPWSVAFLPDGDFLVAEKDGVLQRVSPDGRLTAIAGMPADLDNVRQDPRDNSGLFDVVLHPDFAANGRLYMSYAVRGRGGSTTRLATARLENNTLHDFRVLFTAAPFTEDRFHYGGALLITQDRHLLLAVGERHFNERDNPPLPAAQAPSDPRGKIHRFTLAGAPAPGAVASGLRAVQGMAQDAAGAIWFTEHGSVGGDEINRFATGANYGWPVETSGAYRNMDWKPGQTLPDVTYTAPEYTWGPNQTVAPAGLVVYSGSAFPEWRGDLIIAGLSRGSLMRADMDGGRVVAVENLIPDAPMRYRNAKVSPAGELFIVSDELNGRLVRIDRVGAPPAMRCSVR